MSTRAVIARIKGDGFEGRYHHYDGYPSGLGATLYELAHNRMLGELPAMLKTLLDDHPAGWSTINGADWTEPPGFQENGFTTEGPECFCHGGRSEEAQTITHEDDAGMEWAYIFDEEARTMAVCERALENGDHAIGMFGAIAADGYHWAIRTVVNLDGPEPDWEEIGS